MKNIDAYPVQVTVPVAWGEMDAFGHVNNIIYFRYFETARIRYFEEIGLIEMMKDKGIGPILAETSCRFIKPLLYPDSLTVGAKVRSVGSSSFVMEYLVVSRSLGPVAAGEAVMVTYDYNSSAKVNVPDSVRKAIEALEG